jgi:SAM-dependent methyltransferase
MKMYDELAEWWPLISPAEDYAEEAAFYAATLQRNIWGSCATLLELGSGGGNNASHLKRQFAMTLVDPSAGMLAISQSLNPDCRHLIGDMRDVRLGQQFDGVFIHDAICYMTNESDLLAAMRTAFAHTRPGGAALFAPDYVKEHFHPFTECGGVDGDDRGLRFLEWAYDPDPADSTYLVDYLFALRHSGSDDIETAHDRHVEGLFSIEHWLELLATAGFRPTALVEDAPDVQPGSHLIFVGRRE